MATASANGFDSRKFAKEKFDYLFPTEPVILKTVEIEKKKVVLVLLPVNGTLFDFLSEKPDEEKK